MEPVGPGGAVDATSINAFKSFPWGNCEGECQRGNFIVMGNSRLTVDLTIWYELVTVKLYFH